MTCPANIRQTVIEGSIGTYVTWDPPVVSDNSGTVEFVSSSSSSGDLFPIGVTPVTYTYADSSGNSNSCTFTVTITTGIYMYSIECQRTLWNAEGRLEVVSANCGPSSILMISLIYVCTRLEICVKLHLWSQRIFYQDKWWWPADGCTDPDAISHLPFAADLKNLLVNWKTCIVCKRQDQCPCRNIWNFIALYSKTCKMNEWKLIWYFLIEKQKYLYKYIYCIYCLEHLTFQ